MSKRIVLYQNYYLDSSEARQKEIDFCLRKNIECKLIDEIVLTYNLEARKQLMAKFNSEKIIFNLNPERPTYNDFFRRFQFKMNTIHILSNTDIYFNETLQLVKDYEFKEKECFALSRWDKKSNGSIVPFCFADTQDVWMFDHKPEPMLGADFTLGLPGCDNKIAYLLQQKGYKVLNPSWDIQCTHVHMTEKRNYVTDKDRLPQPYALIPPVKITQI